jgi:hypothetical protein
VNIFEQMAAYYRSIGLGKGSIIEDDPEPVDSNIVQPPGLSYVCRLCDVYGYLTVGERKECWCCGGGERLKVL